MAYQSMVYNAAKSSDFNGSIKGKNPFQIIDKRTTKYGHYLRIKWSLTKGHLKHFKVKCMKMLLILIWVRVPGTANKQSYTDPVRSWSNFQC